MRIHNLTQPPVPREPLDPARLDFGKIFTPDMFVADYRNGDWVNARIQPLEPFSIHPASTVLHYSQTIFEGLKGFRHANGDIVLFRAEMNAKRLRRSAERLAIPPIDESFFLDAVNALVENERHYVPAAPGCLYIRPAVIGVDSSLGVKAASEFIFFILTLPSGPYFKGALTGPGAIDVMLATSVVRAGAGGTGSAKTGGNYAGTLQVTERAKKMGCSQVLFLDTSRKVVEELGGMNFFMVQNGNLRTPPLNDIILDGVTRNSLLTLARELGIETSDAPIPVDELVAGVKDGSVTELIACGTAAVVIGIRSLTLEDGTKLQVSGATPGPTTTRLYEALTGIQYGRTPDTHGWIRKVASVPVEAPVR
jgi:branched-chain amino acid aminotransferase